MPHDTNGKFKGYQAVTLLGGGGFSEVYTATQTSIGREVVIKVIRPDRANQPDFIRRFETEAQIVARLEHPHITPLIDFWRDPQGAYLVMRYLRGGSIYDTIKQQGAIDPATTSHMLGQIAAALDFAHRNDVIHRDIKPGNILLDEDGNAYVADFGIAKDLTVVDPDSQTSPDAVVGSLDYIAPEQARGEPVTSRTDIYSLGVTLYEMLTGKHPFENENPLQRLYKHMTDPLPDLEGLPDDVQATLNEIIQKATAKDPAKRYPDVIALAVAFREAVQARPVEGLTPREIDILILLAERKSNQEIAQELYLSYETVRWHLGNIYKKLGVPNRSQAVKRARELGWLGADDLGDLPSVLTGEFSLVEPDNPYKGLRSFNIEDARDFFGREKAVEKLLQRMTEGSRFQRFLAIVGPSGSGKSSLVKAGLHPSLRNGSLPGSDKWFYVSMKPENHPLDELEIALTKLAANQGQNMRQHLERDERGLVRASELLLPDDGSELFIIIDQFEEVFTLLENEAERQHFLNLLLTAASDARSRVRLVVTLRADYYDKPLHYPEFGEMLRNRMETILPLTATGLEQAIVRPAQRVGVNFEPGLVAQIVSEIHYQAGALPLLQYALTELFEQRQGRLLTLEAYQRIGGVVGALAKGADNIYNGFDTAAQQLTQQIFLRLVTLGEGAEDTRRRATLDELLSIATNAADTVGTAFLPSAGGEVRENEDLLTEILESFTQSRLLTLGHDDGTRQPTVEVAHEAILREWATLREWLNDSRDDIRQERDLAHKADEWQAHKRDESYLLRGTQLTQAEDWRTNSSLTLTPLENDFITASIQQRQEDEEHRYEQQAKAASQERRSRNLLRTLVGVFAGATIISVILLGFLFNAFSNVEAERNNAQRISLAAQGQIVLQSGQPAELASLLALHSLERGYSPEADAVLLTSLQRGFAVREYVGHGDIIRNVQISADGSRIISWSDDHTARIWNTYTGEQIAQFDHGSSITSGSLSPNEHYLITAGTDGKVIIWDTQNGTPLHTLQASTGFAWTGYSSNDTYITTSDNSDTVRLWRVNTGENIRSYTAPGSQFGHMLFTPDNRYILGVGSAVVLWDVETAEVTRRFFGHSDFVTHAAISRDGRQLLTGSVDNTVRLWDITTGQEIRRLEGHTQTIRMIEFSPDGHYGVTSSEDGTVRVWELATGEELNRLEHSGNVYAARYALDKNWIITAGSDRVVRLWALDTPQEPLIFAQEFNSSKRGEHNLGAELLDNDVVLVSGENGGLRWWRREGDQYVIENEQVYGNQLVDVLVYHVVSGQVATASNEGVLQVWDATSGAALWQLAGHEGVILDMAFAPDGNRIVTAGADATARVWDTTTGEQLLELQGHEGSVQAVNFAPDGRTIATGGSDFTARLWDANTGMQLAQFDGHAAAVRDIRFSPDGQYLVSVSNDTTALLWRIDSAELVRQFTGHTDQIWSVAFAPDNRYILTGSADFTARVWDIETGAVVRQLVGHRNGVRSVGFSSDGNHIITGDNEGAYLWYTNLEDLIDFACSLLPRRLTPAERARYSLENSPYACQNAPDASQNMLATWTPQPPVPTALPLVLAPMGEATIFEFEFVSLPVVSIDVMHVPAPDVHIQTADGMVMRLQTLDESVLKLPLYATTHHIPMDFIVPPYDAGPYEQGLPLGFTLEEWLVATGDGTYVVGAGGASLHLNFENMRPNAVYTVWCGRINLPEVTIVDSPCGSPDGSNNSFVTDATGSAKIDIDLPEALLPSTEDIRTVISIAYHSDGRTYGPHPGELGMNSHQQLVYEFPFE